MIFREIAGKTGKYGETAGNSGAGELADLVDFESPMLSIFKLQSQLKRLGNKWFFRATNPLFFLFKTGNESRFILSSQLLGFCVSARLFFRCASCEQSGFVFRKKRKEAGVNLPLSSFVVLCYYKSNNFLSAFTSTRTT